MLQMTIVLNFIQHSCKLVSARGPLIICHSPSTMQTHDFMTAKACSFRWLQVSRTSLSFALPDMELCSIVAVDKTGIKADQHHNPNPMQQVNTMAMHCGQAIHSSVTPLMAMQSQQRHQH